MKAGKNGFRALRLAVPAQMRFQKIARETGGNVAGRRWSGRTGRQKRSEGYGMRRVSMPYKRPAAMGFLFKRGHLMPGPLAARGTSFEGSLRGRVGYQPRRTRRTEWDRVWSSLLYQYGQPLAKKTICASRPRSSEVQVQLLHPGGNMASI